MSTACKEVVSGANYRDDCVIYSFQVFSFFVIPFYNSGGMEGVWVGLLRGLI